TGCGRRGPPTAEGAGPEDCRSLRSAGHRLRPAPAASCSSPIGGTTRHGPSPPVSDPELVVFHRHHDLPTHRLAALDWLAVGTVATELRRHPLASQELGTVLQVVVDVRLAAMPRVAALADHLARADALARIHV